MRKWVTHWFAQGRGYMPSNPEKHHRRSIRLRNYDYSQTGVYFITICAYNWKCLFGEIVVGANGVERCGACGGQMLV